MWRRDVIWGLETWALWVYPCLGEWWISVQQHGYATLALNDLTWMGADHCYQATT
jgi:hypothetical protein